ncbi:MAG: methyltransferase domain-containing protein [Gammaproteobacteria bacterium]|nr:methyltransferase domain-containing protein [Gammaproteobacteria bacterium]
MSRKTVYETSTDKAKVRIEQHRQQLHLKFDSDREAIQSAIDIKQPHRLVMHNLVYLMGILLFISPPKRILLLGVGGGALVHFFRHYLPASRITAVDYNAELLQIASREMQLPAADEHLQYLVADAREYSESCAERYDLIVVDIFDAGLTPGWLLQQPFSQQLRQCLTARGGLAYNLLPRSEHQARRFQQMLDKLLHQQTLYLETEAYENLLVYGLNFKTKARTLEQQLAHCAELEDQYELPMCQILSMLYDRNPQGSGIL